MSETLTYNQRTLAEALLDNGLLQFGVFTLKSGTQSPVYLDLRMLQRFPDGVEVAAVNTYIEMVRGVGATMLAPVPWAAVGPVGIVSYQEKIPMVTPRLDKKDHGTGVIVDGLLSGDRGRVVTVCDDVISTAGSKLEAIAVLEAAGLSVRDVVVLLDRETGGLEQLAERGYNLHSALTMKPFLEHLHRTGRLNDYNYDRTMNFLDRRPWQ